MGATPRKQERTAGAHCVTSITFLSINVSVQRGYRGFMRRCLMLAVLAVLAAAFFGGSYAFANPTRALKIPILRPAGSDRCTLVYCVPTGRVLKIRAASPGGSDRCTLVYCVAPAAVPSRPATGRAPKIPILRPAGSDRCTLVYCVQPAAVPSRPA
jgi:hypothetical protein